MLNAMKWAVLALALALPSGASAEPPPPGTSFRLPDTIAGCRTYEAAEQLADAMVSNAPPETLAPEGCGVFQNKGVLLAGPSTYVGEAVEFFGSPAKVWLIALADGYGDVLICVWVEKPKGVSL